MTTATLRGRVTNEGQGLPGVLVTVTSSALQGARTTSTSANGDFVVPGPPAGRRTPVTFTLQGFRTETRTQPRHGRAGGAPRRRPRRSPASRRPRRSSRSPRRSRRPRRRPSQTFTKDLTDDASRHAHAPLVGRARGGREHERTRLERPHRERRRARRDDLGRPVLRQPLHGGRRRRDGQHPRHAEQPLHRGRDRRDDDVDVHGLGGVRPLHGRRRQHRHEVGRQRVLAARSARRSRTPRGPRRRPRTRSRRRRSTRQYEATLGGPIWKDHVWFFGSGRYFDQTTLGPDELHEHLLSRSATRRSATRASSRSRPSRTTRSPATTCTSTRSRRTRPSGRSWISRASSRRGSSRRTSSRSTTTASSRTRSSSRASTRSRKFTFENSGSPYTDLIQGTLMRDLSRGNARYNSPTFCGVCDPESRDNRDTSSRARSSSRPGSLGSHNIVLGYDNFSGQRKANNYQSGSNYRLFTTIDDPRERRHLPRHRTRAPTSTTRRSRTSARARTP